MASRKCSLTTKKNQEEVSLLAQIWYVHVTLGTTFVTSRAARLGTILKSSEIFKNAS